MYSLQGYFFMLAHTIHQKQQPIYRPKNSVAIFCGAGLEVFGLLNVPKNLKIRFLWTRPSKFFVKTCILRQRFDFI